MRLWILILLIIPFSYGIQMRETEYECGAHGRFEYCIDGVPGCVIGCHCHPGYYFDTDTKICEPNIRLSQNFRRNYDMLEPTRVFTPPTPPVIEEPATTVKNAVDEKIDIITKDADDLGDWLYNQFFKTIENQVINETKNDSIITRRSESDPTLIKKPTRRSHKYWKARRKKKNKKKKGLKSKLLRITEDDSLFDSSSSSTSDESSDSSSSSASEETRQTTKEKKRKSDHGHKKIVVFNKRPKPPLPSFIFLPNMETPFFPPIGLPPPPMPMYPMVPVPPMMGPFPFPAAQTPCGAETNKTNGHAITEPSHTDKTPPHPTENPPNDNIIDENSADMPPNENPSDDLPADEHPPDHKAPDENPPDETPQENVDENNPAPSETPSSLLRSRAKKRRGPRNKLVQKLRDKLKRKNKLQNYFASEYQSPPIVPPGFIPSHPPHLRHKTLTEINEEEVPSGFIPNHLAHWPHKPLPEINVEEEVAGLQDVDFKYLSQLIHRADLNKSRQSLSTTTSAVKTENVLPKPPPSRRNYYYSYPDQITQVLNNLTNQPMNHIPENQPAYDSNQHTYNVPNQPTYNMPSQPMYNVPIQPTYNMPSQPIYNVPNQPAKNMPIQPNYNVPNPPINNIPSQPTYNVPNQTAYNTLNHPINNIHNPANYNLANCYVPNHPNNHALNQPTYNQSTSSLANQPTHVSLNPVCHNIPYRKKIEDTNDVYYSNLGRQIASMIRNIDGDKEVDIEIKSSPQILNNPVLPGNSGSRSYWERSVRSPYTNIMNTFKKQINRLKLSNEDLFSLENKVEIAASTEPALSLHQLENIISKMQKAKSKFIRINGKSHRPLQSSKSSYNVNLLPENNQQFNRYEKVNKRVQSIQPNLSKSNMINSSKTRRQNAHWPIQLPPIRSNLLTDFMFTLQIPDEILNETTSKTNTYQTNTYVTNIIPTRKPDPIPAPQFMYKMPNPHFKSYAYTVLPLPPKPPLLTNMQSSHMQATTSKAYYQQLSPMLLNHKAVSYYDQVNNNRYLYKKASIPLKPQSFPLRRAAPVTRHETFGKRVDSSYFHHEVHNFDYFDDLL